VSAVAYTLASEIEPVKYSSPPGKSTPIANLVSAAVAVKVPQFNVIVFIKFPFKYIFKLVPFSSTATQ